MYLGHCCCSVRICSNSCPLSWWCHPTVSSSVVPFSYLPSSFPSIRVFSSESIIHIRWTKYWSFILSISPSNEYSGLISFRIDWFDLLAVRKTLKSLLQHHSSKASILLCSAFFIVQLSHPYMTTGKTMNLCWQVGASKAAIWSLTGETDTSPGTLSQLDSRLLSFGTSQCCPSVDVGHPLLMIYMLLLLSIVSISFKN